MLAETFQKPKPIIGKVQLLALPGSPGWGGHWEELVTRAEQEATALATGGVDALLIENTHDAPFSEARTDVAGAIAMAMIIRRIRNFTQLPVGVTVLQNDPETALAIALNTDVAFIRMPLITGALISESGVVQSKLNELLHYKSRLKTSLPLILADVSASHLVPERPGQEPAHDIDELNLEHLLNVAMLAHKQGIAGGLILNDAELPAEQIADFKAQLPLSVFVENRQAPKEDVMAYYEEADGLILDSGIRKQGGKTPGILPTIDMTRVEETVNRLKGVKSVTEMDPDIFLKR